MICQLVSCDFYIIYLSGRDPDQLAIFIVDRNGCLTPCPDQVQCLRQLEFDTLIADRF